MKTETEIDLETLLPDDSVDHGVCPICYPEDSGIQIAICGADVTGEILMPIQECVNLCKACVKEEMHHKLLHILGRL